MALVEAAGGEPFALGIAKDRLEDVDSRLCAALIGGADAIVVSGGVSVGPYDVVKLAFEKIGRIDLWRVAVQPGKPFAFGVADRPDGGRTLLFGLPGNPVSSFVTFELFVRPAIRASPATAPIASSGRSIARSSTSRVTKSHGRRAFLRVDRGARRERIAGPRRTRPRPRPARRRIGGAGEPRHLGPCRRRRAGGGPGGAGYARRRRGRRALVARRRLTRR